MSHRIETSSFSDSLYVMVKRTVTFIATQYKNKPVNVSFYTKDGERVKFTTVEKAPVRTRVRFRASSHRS